MLWCNVLFCIVLFCYVICYIVLLCYLLLYDMLLYVVLSLSFIMLFSFCPLLVSSSFVSYFFLSIYLVVYLSCCPVACYLLPRPTLAPLPHCPIDSLPPVSLATRPAPRSAIRVRPRPRRRRVKSVHSFVPLLSCVHNNQARRRKYRLLLRACQLLC